MERGLRRLLDGLDCRVACDAGAGEADGGDLGGVFSEDSVFGVNPGGPGTLFGFEGDGGGFFVTSAFEGDGSLFDDDFGRFGFAGGEPGGFGDEGVIFVESALEACAEESPVLHEGFHAEVDVSGGGLLFAREADLVADFLGFPGTSGGVGSACVESGPDVALLVVDLDPVVEEDGVGLGGLGDWPVELGRVVVAPAFFEPLFGVGVELCVLVNSGFDGFGDAGAVDAEGGDSELDVALLALDFFVELLDEVVDVFATPVVFVHSFAVLGVAGGVGEVDFLLVFVEDWVGVEVVVYVDAVDVVAFDDVDHDVEGALLDGGLAWVHPEVGSVLFDHCGVGFAEVVVGDGVLLGWVLGAVGVEPAVQFDAVFVAFVHHEFEGVPGGVGGLALLAGEVFAPGFEFAFVEGVGRGADLEDEGVEVELFCPCDDVVEVSLLGFDAVVAVGGPVDVVDGGDPGSAEFAVDGRKVVLQRCKGDHRGEHSSSLRQRLFVRGNVLR